MWRFTDGTTVRVGGFVEGDAPLADDLRAELAAGAVVFDVPHLPWPERSQLLDPDDPRSVDLWLEQRSAPYDGVQVEERPGGLPAWIRKRR